jgi:hypothetical protein
MRLSHASVPICLEYPFLVVSDRVVVLFRTLLLNLVLLVERVAAAVVEHTAAAVAAIAARFDLAPDQSSERQAESEVAAD